MYVHLGGAMVVPVLEVVTILDVRLVAAAEVNREFMERAAADGRMRGDGLTPECKAIVVTRDGTVFTSGISAGTLARRMTHLQQSARAWEAET